MSVFKPYKFGKYQVIDKIASGGMAELLKAKISGEHGFEKVLAIKKIHSHFESEDQLLEAFIDEARLAAQLHHHNIVQVVDFGSVQGEYFIAMEYLEGFDLRTLLERTAKSGLQLDPPHAFFIIAKTCEALQYAHSLKDENSTPLNIVHRDISPANIFITSSGDVKVIDFGIARAASHNQSTMVGSLKGKIPYMAPEQALGSDVDHRIDIYAVGAILYEIFSGHRLFASAGVETLEQVKRGEFVAPEESMPGRSEDFYRILNKSLAADRDDRYQSCFEMLDDIESYMAANNMRPTNRSLKSFVESLAPLPVHEKQHEETKEVLDATMVCDISEPDEQAETAERTDLAGKLRAFPGKISRFFREHLPKIAVITILLLLSFLIFLHASRRYTAYNLWVSRTSTLYSINYKGNGALLPAGSLVKDVEVDEENNKIYFKTEEDREITIDFNPKWHPGKSVKDYADALITGDDFGELTDDLSDKEINAIKTGILVDGMSKEAVLVDYGPPPELGTVSTEANQWTYWYRRFDKREICFDDDERLLPSCPDDTIEGKDKNVLENLGGKIQNLIDSL